MTHTYTHPTADLHEALDIMIAKFSMPTVYFPGLEGYPFMSDRDGIRGVSIRVTRSGFAVMRGFTNTK